jgi:membrane-bound metal-dependent hydrolase YbcI (DUF457 family)
MFIGHFAVGFAAKKFAPRTSLAWLITAPLWPDVLWPIFILLGWERVRIDPGNTRFTPFDFVYYPWSHSLLMCAVWATALAAAYYGITKYRAGATAIWAGVISHWILDWLTHRADMPLYWGGPKFGLGLWNSVAGTMAAEIAMFVAGIWLYASTTRARDRIGRYGFGAYVALLLAIYIADHFSPPPASIGEVAWTGVIAIALMIPWAWWFDHHRSLRSELKATGPES